MSVNTYQSLLTTDMDDTTTHFLDEVWTCYFHEPSDHDWTTSSYFRVSDISSIEDFATIRYSFRNRHTSINDGMFFVMREHVFPCWDDRHNIEGGCLSMKVPKKSADEFWDELCVRVMSDTLASKKEDMELVNGISISPKTFYSIIKIWLSEEIHGQNFDIPRDYIGNVVYKRNRDFIRACQTTMSPHPSSDPVARDTA